MLIFIIAVGYILIMSGYLWLNYKHNSEDRFDDLEGWIDEDERDREIKSK